MKILKTGTSFKEHGYVITLELLPMAASYKTCTLQILECPSHSSLAFSETLHGQARQNQSCFPLFYNSVLIHRHGAHNSRWTLPVTACSCRRQGSINNEAQDFMLVSKRHLTPLPFLKKANLGFHLYCSSSRVLTSQRKISFLSVNMKLRYRYAQH